MFLSGLVVPETRGNETVPEVVTTSGYALLHFFSDAAYNLTGFTITYSYVEMSFSSLCLSVVHCSVLVSVSSDLNLFFSPLQYLFLPSLCLCSELIKMCFECRLAALIYWMNHVGRAANCIHRPPVLWSPDYFDKLT